MATAKPCVDNPSFNGLWGPNPSTERGNNFHLGVHPREPKLIYPSGKFIIVRDIENPSDCFVYRGHNVKTTVAKFSPNGFWVASADIHGKVRIWAWDNPEHMLKIEVFGLGGAIKDLAWGPESKRIVVCGEGTGMNARAFAWDTGSSLGEVTGHTKRATSCDYRPCRPYRVMTASEDMRSIFYKGPPFSLDHSNKDQHSNFINCVRFSPDGSRIATCGSDKLVWLYDGTTGEPASKLNAGHAGSIYSLAWSTDSAKIITSSADKTVRLWDASTGECEHTWKFLVAGQPTVGDMQVAVAYVGGQAVSVSLKGDLNLLDPVSELPRSVIQSHQAAITAMTPYPVPTSGALLTGSFMGVVCSWDPTMGLAQRCGGGKAAPLNGACHSNKVSGIAACSLGVVSVGWDDTLRLAPLDALVAGEAPSFTQSVGTSGQPCGVAANPSSDVVVVTTNQGVMLLRGVTPLHGVSTDYTPTSVALNPMGDEAAVGGQDGKIRVYKVVGDELVEGLQAIEGHRGEVSCLSYSPDGTMLAAGDALREVMVWARAEGSVPQWEAKVRGLWQFHTTRVSCCSWAPGGRLLATGGVDENIFVWSVDKPRRRVHYPFAHKDGVEGLAWLSDGELASAGADHCVSKWQVAKDVGVFDD
ncbi:unnamed protein product [Discosporangium mesarthrocarpum]